MAFVQIIEMQTSRIDEVQKLMDGWVAATKGKRTAHRAVLAQDRDRPGTYVQIVEFPSFEEAMANSALPETSNVAEQMEKLCDGPAGFRNLDVVWVDDLS